MYYIHKHEVWQEYGGPEEGGWWYECGRPVDPSEWEPAPFRSEDDAYAACRVLNDAERIRRKTQEKYEYTSVLSYKSTHYAYSVQTVSEPFDYPQKRPHYE
jgi:hypothetical protein